MKIKLRNLKVNHISILAVLVGILLASCSTRVVKRAKNASEVKKTIKDSSEANRTVLNEFLGERYEKIRRIINRCTYCSYPTSKNIVNKVMWSSISFTDK